MSSPPSCDQTAHEWRLVGVLTLLSALALIDKQIYALVATPIKRDLDLSDTQLSILLGAAFALANIAISIPAGYLADRYSRRMVVAGGAAVWSVMTALCGMAHSYAMMFLARAGLGLSEGLIPPASLSMIRDEVSKPRLGRALSIYASANMTGAAIALLLGGALLAALGASPLPGDLAPWRAVLIIVGLGGLPFALLLFLVREPPRQSAASNDETTFAAAFAHMAARRWVYAPLMLFMVAHAMISVTFGAWLPSMAERTWGLEPQQLAFPLGLMMLALAPIGLWITGLAIDSFSTRGRIGAAPVGLAATVLIGVAAVAAPASPDTEALWPRLAFLTLVGGAFYPISTTIIATLAPTRAVGKILSLQLVLQGVLAASTAPTIAALTAETVFGGAPGALAQAIGALNGLYAFVALLAIVAVNIALRRAPAIAG